MPLEKVDDTAAREDLDNTGNPADADFVLKYGEPEDVKFGQWEGKTTKEILENDPDYILWVDENFDDPSDYIESEVEQMKEMVEEARQRLDNRQESEHVGKPGERDRFEIRIQKSIAYEDKGKRRRVVLMRDKDNNRLTTFLRRSANIAHDLNRAAPKNRDQNLLIEAKVVKHKKYDGENDTIITNTEILRDGVGELERESPPKGESYRERRLNNKVDEFFETWQDTLFRRIKKFSKARRMLKEKPFTDEEIDRLDDVFQTLLETHESRKESIEQLKRDGYGSVQGNFNL